MPTPFLMGGHIVSPLSVRPVRMKNSFRAISFENIGVLDSYFIHMYVYYHKIRSSSIMDKFNQLL